MKIKAPGLIRMFGFCASSLLNIWMSTLDYKLALYDPNVDPAILDDGKSRLYLFWHEYMQFFIYLRHHCNLAMLLSRHSDADVLEKVAHQLGFGTVRGSTARGGGEAIRQLMHKAAGEHWHLTITPDGPRGPRRKMAHGSVYLASRLGIEIIPLGVGYDRPWQTPTWDRFALPRPYSRARLIAGPPIFIPPDIDKNEIDEYTQKIERLINQLTDLAEDWAVKGYRIENAADMLPGPKRHLLYFARSKQSGIAAFGNREKRAN